MFLSSIFRYDNFKGALQQFKDRGYQLLSCSEYIARKEAILKSGQPTLVLRADIDESCKKAKQLAAIFNELDVHATFFVRLHGDEYNPFSFENYNCLKFIRDTGHEIGYHSEIMDQATIWNEDAALCLRRDIGVLEEMLSVKVKGVASHGGITGLNNLDFWKDQSPSDFDLVYEAYDSTNAFGLFADSIYISDSNYGWKHYVKGKRHEGGALNLLEHLEQDHPLIYLNVHPAHYFRKHIYE